MGERRCSLEDMERLKKNLVFGASGLVGQSLMKHLPEKDTQGYGHSKQRPGIKKLNILDHASLIQEIENQNPETIYWAVNFSGGVNRCEYSSVQSTEFHLDTTKTLVDICKKSNIRLVFISTDYVFADSTVKRKETDSTYPLNVYGKLKLEAEKYIEKNLSQYIIGRTTNVYGWDPETTTPNFYMQMYRKFSKNESVSIPECLKGNPTFVDDLAQALISLVKNNDNGIFHLVGPENLSRIDWAKKIASSMEKKHELVKKSEKFVNTPQRPLNLELSTEKFKSLHSFSFKTVDEALVQLNQQRKNRD